jgi:hypothetical protein
MWNPLKALRARKMAERRSEELVHELDNNLARVRKLVGTNPTLREVVDAQQDAIDKLIKAMPGYSKPKGKYERRRAIEESDT